MSNGTTEPSLGPAPFSAEWNDDPPTPERPRRVPLGTGRLPASLPGWLPSERLLTAFLVLVIILGTAAFTTTAAPATQQLDAPEVNRTPGPDTAAVPAGPAALAAGPTTVAAAGAATGSSGVSNPVGLAAGSDASADTVASANTAASNEAADQRRATGNQAVSGVGDDFPRDADGNLFPNNRIVAYYGTSLSNLMGILGEDTIDNTYAVLMDQVAEWQAADPDTNVIPAFEFIATVAQPTPQSDGTFLYDISFDDIQEYIDFAADHDMLVFIDVQVGARGVQAEVERLEPLLKQPNVMLAVDPEFAVHGDEIPGEDYGHIDADDVNWTMQYLADLSQTEGIPQKVLMVHQFRYDMIENKENIQDTPGVELVLHADGHGSPDLKRETYGVVVSQWADQIAFWAGFKVFYNKPEPERNQYTDIPNMTPEEILQLDPVPYYISYQ